MPYREKRMISRKSKPNQFFSTIKTRRSTGFPACKCNGALLIFYFHCFAALLTCLRLKSLFQNEFLLRSRKMSFSAAKIWRYCYSSWPVLEHTFSVPKTRENTLWDGDCEQQHESYYSQPLSRKVFSSAFCLKIRGSSALNTTEGSICTLCAFGMCILLL